MKPRTIIFALCLTISFPAMACECAGGWGKNFLHQVKKFDVVVYGTFLREPPNRGDAKLIVKKVYKGVIKSDTINLRDGGLDCNIIFPFESGTQLVIGLKNSSFGSKNTAFMADGCVTSILFPSGKGRVSTSFGSARPDILGPKINWIRSSMKLSKFERKMARRE